jgi:hypothetical protein
MTAMKPFVSHPPVFTVTVSAALAIAIAASVYQSAHRPDSTSRPIILVQSMAH